MDSFGDTQQKLLRALLRKKAGLTADALVEVLKVTKTAVRQHLAALSDLGIVSEGGEIATGGRPGRLYKLTQKGIDLFPKQYSWFSELLITSIKSQSGTEGLEKLMSSLGQSVAESVKANLAGKTGRDRLEAIVDLMNQLAFEAESIPLAESNGGVGIQATNCVYHALAVQHPEVCKMDLALLSALMGEEVTQSSCIVRGGNSCVFAFGKAAARSSK